MIGPRDSNVRPKTYGTPCRLDRGKCHENCNKNTKKHYHLQREKLAPYSNTHFIIFISKDIVQEYENVSCTCNLENDPFSKLYTDIER